MREVIRKEVELVKTDRSTILLGFEVGSAKLDDGRKLSITASGKIVRFTLYNTETQKCIVEYDLDLTPLAKAVVDTR